MKKRAFLFVTAVLAAAFLFACATAAPVQPSGPQEWVNASGGDGTVTFYVTRHGKTLFNTVERAQGWSDTPLTAPGVEVAVQLGKGLAKKGVKFNAAWSSDSGRARETAHLALDNSGNGALALRESPNLRESGFGIFEGETNNFMWGSAAVALGLGKTPEEGIRAIYGAMGQGKVSIGDVLGAVKKLDESSKTPTGMAESYDDVQGRMRKQITALAEEYAAKGGGNVLLVAHGISIMTMIDGWPVAEGAGKFNNGQLDNASVTKVVYKDGEFTVTELNNMEYVEAGK
jgi:probable phosphoglycerate mutase